MIIVCMSLRVTDVVIVRCPMFKTMSRDAHDAALSWD